jgi:hypothetical protein
MKTLSLLIIVFCVLALPSLGEDITTLSGKTYSNVTITRVEPDGITIKHSAGLIKLFYGELPEDVRARYGADPAKAREYQQAKAQAQAQREAQSRETIAARRENEAASLNKIYRKEKETEAARQAMSKPPRYVVIPGSERRISHGAAFDLMHQPSPKPNTVVSTPSGDGTLEPIRIYVLLERKLKNGWLCSKLAHPNRNASGNQIVLVGLPDGHTSESLIAVTAMRKGTAEGGYSGQILQQWQIQPDE